MFIVGHSCKLGNVLQLANIVGLLFDPVEMVHLSGGRNDIQQCQQSNITWTPLKKVHVQGRPNMERLLQKFYHVHDRDKT